MLDLSKKMMQYQYDLNEKAASINRNWQERMANSAHQREIADLKAAGLNPVLSVTGGSGANTPTGSTASVSDGSGYASALAGLQAAQLNSATQWAMHTTPGANTLAGQLQYISELVGLPFDEVLGALGQFMGLKDSSTSSNSSKGLSRVIQFTKTYVNPKKTKNTIYEAMVDLEKKRNNALGDGDYRKASKYDRQLDRLKYFYPAVAEKLTGEYDYKYNYLYDSQDRHARKFNRDMRAFWRDYRNR